MPDHCVSGDVVRYLCGLRKVTVMRFEQIGLRQNADDVEVITAATKERLLLVTGDKRFTERDIPLCSHEGIIKFEVTKPATRLSCIKKFMRMQERHNAWKGITHLYERHITQLGHDGIQRELRYP